ncbi:DNA-3-methyladenine glycosylase 1 [Rubripirellula tenax]|uniref:DNA-3-methyladenine glycosylase 1 n=1 Tax=Rubripirellula tenax TaxID=2528015 RepID=A0A5C6F907_9BACT|nr:DNA-3-methyladenine glycosylase I [Rubripirellula tenax]TWU56897.1 DNA-3-methyladenine glycosylase 1 [Rubripirellula tenax]
MSNDEDLLLGSDSVNRCWWCGSNPEYVQYHDEEWGMPIDDDTRLFEKMCLEGFQSGLSWLTILKKRNSFRTAFDGFNFQKVVHFDQTDVDRLMANASIVRHRGKIQSTINNAGRAIEMVAEFGSLATFFWSFEAKRHTSPKTRADVVPMTDESTRMSKEMKRRGWTFVGPTTCYAMMQSMGIVNDHLRRCHHWKVVQDARKAFVRPSL